jgi:uncharacterized protein
MTPEGALPMEAAGPGSIAAPVAPRDRIEAIDAVRGVALFGVLIVNLVTEFRVSIFQQLLPGPSGVGSDFMVERVVALGFQSKAFCLFALLFGVGLAIQFERLSVAGRPLYWLARRLAALLGFGVIHLLFIWNGDILTEYALAGFAVLPFVLLPARALLLAALLFLTAYAAAPALYSIGWPSAAALRAHVASANQVYATGTLAEIWQFSLGELPWLLKLHLGVFLRTLALFVLGMFLWKAGILGRQRDFRSETLIAAIMGIALGAVLTAAEVNDALDGLGAAAQALADLAPVLLALGYGAALLSLAELSATRRVLSAFAPLGRMAFTNYVLQSIILGFIFFGYGLGHFGRMGAAAAFALGMGVYAGQLVFSRWWLRRYRFGPIEWLWRTLMYGGAQPIGRAASHG